MKDSRNLCTDILTYLQYCHSGAEEAVPSGVIERSFGISGRTVREIVNTLRREGKPVCSDANGYFYAKSRAEIKNTVAQLLGRSRKITAAAQGLILSLEKLCDEREGQP